MRAIGAGIVLVAFAACSRTERREPAVAVAPAIVDPAPEPVVEAAPASGEAASEDVTYTPWDGFGPRGCAFMAPVGPSPEAVDVVFHFHAGQMSDRELRASGVRAVFVSCGWGVGTAPYSSAFADERRFEGMMKTVLRRVGAKRVRKLALVSWSAGFASISKILRVPRYYAMTDAVVLLDSLHSAYDAHHAPDMRMLDPFVRFARDAAAGEKAMVITHSAIVPPGYASSTEASEAVLAAIDVPIHDPDGMRFGRDAMRLATVADAGDLHLRGFRGTGPHDHFDHLHLVGDVLATWVRPRWYTRRGEQP